MSDALKPCPFCGGVAHQFKDSGDERVGYVSTVKISCRNCAACVADHDTRDKNGWVYKDDASLKAADKWNRRADLEAPASLPMPLTTAQIMADPRVQALVDALDNEAISHEEDSGHCSENGFDSGRVYHANKAKKLRSILAQLKETKE